MSQVSMNKQFKIFEHGSTWLRVDFHLHTNAAKEFNKSGYEENDFCRSYVEKLVEQQIQIGVITNHNKFDLPEFKELRKNALKEEIYLIPGVEFSATDGAKGIHVLIAFNDNWIYNKQNTNYIEQFINAAFIGIPNPDIPPYPNSKYSMSETYDMLCEFKKDFLFVLAHIDDSSGMFNELKGRNLESFVNSEAFNRKVLGLQKSRDNDYLNKLNFLLKDKQLTPALVEGTDYAKGGIDSLGKGNEINGVTQKTYLKLGAYNFEAIKYALLDKKFRVSKSPPKSTNGYIKSITINGKKFNGTINFNHAMNNLIGIRGGGKSSILEIVRYGLDIELSEKEHTDYDYKNKLLNAILGSGGTIRCELIDNKGNQFITEKTLGDTHSNVFNAENELQPGLKPNHIVQKPIYYGQKDLSNIGDDLSNENLIGKLVGDKLLETKDKIEEKKQQILSLLNHIENNNVKLARKKDYEEKLADLKHKIQIFKEHKIDKKLDKQIRFDKDLNFVARVVKFEDKVIEALKEFNEEYKDDFATFHNYEAKVNGNKKDIEAVAKSLLEFETIFNTLSKSIEELIKKNTALRTLGKRLKEKFKVTKDLDIKETQLSELDKLSKKKKELSQKLSEALETIRKLWHTEFTLTQNEIEKVNNEQPIIKENGNEVKTLEILLGFRENKKAFKSYLKENFTGTGLTNRTYVSLTEHYPDLISLYYDLDKKESELKNILTDTQLLSFRTYFKSNLGAFLTYRTPDKLDILYKGRPINEHSLGQRASALIIFLLTLKDSDLIIIDQPEDDLDNQTIYNDVIKVLKDLKNNSQFIFATHNPNIPVLGDCEQIITCRYNDEKIEIEQGSVDSEQSRKDIVNIMEGGKEAFDNRKMIYELWTQ